METRQGDVADGRVIEFMPREVRLEFAGVVQHLFSVTARFAYASTLLLALAISACKPLATEPEPLPVFDGVTTDFALTRSKIRAYENLQVHVVIHNTASTTREFRFLDFNVNARLYSNGQLIEDRCPMDGVPVQCLTLKPGETMEGTVEVVAPVCYKLAPGPYSIRFNYDLKAASGTEEEIEYPQPIDGLLPWDGRDHPFTVVK